MLPKSLVMSMPASPTGVVEAAGPASCQPECSAAIVYHAAPREPLLLARVVLAMSVLGLIATWIPAQRALSLNPVTLLRQD